MDLIMISQFAYYKLKNQKVTKCSHNLRNFCISWVVVCGALCVPALSQLLLRNQEQSTAIPRNSSSLGVVEMSGFICGSMFWVFYLGRIPSALPKQNFREMMVFDGWKRIDWQRRKK